MEILDAEVAEAVDYAAFEVAGGPAGVVMRLAAEALKWVSIGVLVHVGWRIVG